MFVSTAHTLADVDQTIAAIEAVAIIRQAS
jgi:glutamate-1-semialdehyde aminotransferase